MKCPKCGADNPDSAEYCSLCAEELTARSSPGPGRTARAAPGEGYRAPSEWRGDAEVLRPEVSKVVVKKMQRFRIRMAVYGVIIAAIITWLALSFTVWGNPSPGKISMQLIDAANARDEEAFTGCFHENDLASAASLYDSVVLYLGALGRYEQVKLDVEESSAYEAYAYIENGVITSAGGSSLSVDVSEGLKIALENHGGRWYVVPRGTDIIP